MSWQDHWLSMDTVRGKLVVLLKAIFKGRYLAPNTPFLKTKLINQISHHWNSKIQ